MSQLENTPGKPEFKQLWPTQFMSLSLPGHDTANPVLADHLLEQNIARDDMTVDYTSDNLFMTDHPAVIWLRQCCDRAVLDYARHAGVDYDLEWILQGWANVNMRGDYHNLHNHPQFMAIRHLLCFRTRSNRCRYIPVRFESERH